VKNSPPPLFESNPDVCRHEDQQQQLPQQEQLPQQLQEETGEDECQELEEDFSRQDLNFDAEVLNSGNLPNISTMPARLLMVLSLVVLLHAMMLHL
jgi:hypothetical protein